MLVLSHVISETSFDKLRMSGFPPFVVSLSNHEWEEELVSYFGD